MPSTRTPPIRRLTTLVLLAGIACSSGKATTKDSAARTGATSPVLERHRLDLDSDGTADEIVAMRGDSATQTSRIELRLSKVGTRVLEDSGRWAPAPEEFNANGNLVPSRLLYVADFHRAGRLLWLFGARHGCCQQSLTIYRLGANGPEKYFAEPELWIDRSPIPQPSAVAIFAGRKLSEGVAPPSSEYVSAVSYAPVVAYRLEERPRVDSAMTRKLTVEELGGFAGFRARTDVAALRRRDGSKLLWDVRARRPLP